MGNKNARTWKKRNWKKLQKEYSKGNYADLVEFAEKKDIPYKTVLRQSCKHKWAKSAKEAHEKALEMVAVSQAEKILKFRNKKELMGQKLQADALKKIFITPVNALDHLKAGVKFEGEAIGDGEQDRNINQQNNQQNIYFNQAVQIIKGENGNPAITGAIKKMLHS